MRARNLRDVKIVNKYILYDCIRENKKMSIAELERATNLSHPTVSNLIRDMENDGVIVKSGQGASSGGRAPMVYSINADAYYAVGVDFEFPNIHFSITNLEYRCVISRRVVFEKDARPEDIIERMVRETEALMEQSGIPRELFLGLGLGLPGVLNKERESVTIERIRGWKNIPIGRIMAERLGMPVYVENDVNLMALAEYRLYPNADIQDRLFIVVRYGIGMGIIMNGQLLEGSHGNAGRIGHSSVNADGPLCVCGNRGCLSLYASEHAMLDRYERESGERAEGMRDLVPRAKLGDQTAVRVLREAGYYLGSAVVGMTYLFDVSYVTVCTQFDPVYMKEEIEKAIDQRLAPYNIRQIELRVMGDIENQFSIGGCILVIDAFNRHESIVDPKNRDGIL